MALIAPSILAADLARLGAAIHAMKSLGASMVHVDVKDGHYVPEISMGQPVVKRIRKATDLPLDVHLMIERPERYVEDFIKAGADRIAIHAEATPDVYRAVKLARNGGVKAGLALNPGTPVETGLGLLEELDYLLIMATTAECGEGTFIRSTISKVAAAAKERTLRRLDVAIEVEGGIGAREAEELVLAGADILVLESAILDRNGSGEAMPAWASVREAFAKAGQRSSQKIH